MDAAHLQDIELVFICHSLYHVLLSLRHSCAVVLFSSLSPCVRVQLLEPIYPIQEPYLAFGTQENKTQRIHGITSET